MNNGDVLCGARHPRAVRCVGRIYLCIFAATFKFNVFIMKKNYLPLFVLGILMCACGQTKETTFDQYGISFTCPAGWEVTEAEDYGPTQYISVEKNGFNASSVVTIATSDEEYELEEYLKVFQGSFKEQDVYKNLRLQPAKAEAYGKHQGISSSYTADVLTLPHEGKMYVFRTGRQIVCIVEQSAKEDRKVSQAGFETIRDSFSED